LRQEGENEGIRPLGVLLSRKEKSKREEGTAPGLSPQPKQFRDRDPPQKQTDKGRRKGTKGGGLSQRENETAGGKNGLHKLTDRQSRIIFNDR